MLNASNESTAGLNVEEALGNPYQANSIVPPSTANAKVMLVRSANTSDLIGCSDAAFRAEESYHGGASASPSKFTYWLLTM